ncbi:MAG: SH3 domain-containing protein [Deltaproteobacteria bacterium]
MKRGYEKIILLIIVFSGLLTVSEFISGKSEEKIISETTPGKYETMLNQGSYSEDIFYNAGNEYLYKNDFPHAILYYEKALKTSPFDKRIIHNLNIARRNIDSPIDELPDFFIIRWLKSFVFLFLPDTWAVITVISAFIAVSLLIFRWYRKPDLNLMIIWIPAFVFIISLTGSYYRNYLLHHQICGILMAPAQMYSAPGERSQKIYDLPAGEKLILTDSLNDWYEIILVNKEKGWIRKDKAEKI